MFSYFYNSSIRRYVILMMELFSHVQVQRVRNGEARLIDVPISYGSKEKFVAMLNKINMPNSEENIAKVETILPRLNLNMVDMSYNEQFKTAITNRRSKTLPDDTMVDQFNPVPYSFTFELGIYTRHEDDMFQIVEQILPYFQPHFACSITELYDNKIIIKGRNVNIVMTGLMMDEEIEGEMSGRRRIEWTMMFNFNGWIYPNTKNLKGQIKTIYLDFFENEKEIGEFESVDHQVQPIDVDKDDWDGTVKSVYSRNTQHGEPPRP